ncbi:ImmA/IrrE family metallo-endopeptidase [Pseudonocardia sp. GCM10023141]|uniref:ImmA/IrrE family metallo-endopeptidase n=1 Tax=Pseudonocardia sp. GCM10023141 TaxID=3252653 RepID=UPI00361CD88B
MIALLEATTPELLTALCDDAVAALERHPEVALRLIPESDTGDGCTVAGGYRGSETPPALVVTTSLSHRRRAFTALHEFGHHLQRTNLDLAERLLEHPAEEELEEAACQVFASRVLLPDALVSPITPSRGPDATTVAEFYSRSNASRAACCVRAAELLTGGGAVVLYRENGTVDMATSTGLIPPARGSDQSATPLIARALARPGNTVEHDDTSTSYSTGTSDLLYGQATWVDGYIVAVLMPDNASWKPLALPRPGTSTYTGPSKWATCDQCLREFTVTDDVCARCAAPRCPRRHCACPSSVGERTCRGCHLTLAKARFADFADPSTPCRDCT